MKLALCAHYWGVVGSESGVLNSKLQTVVVFSHVSLLNFVLFYSLFLFSFLIRFLFPTAALFITFTFCFTARTWIGSDQCAA